MTAAPLPGPDQSLLKKLRLRIETDDPLYPGWRKLKIRGKDLNDLPSEVFWLNELEVCWCYRAVCCRETLRLNCACFSLYGTRRGRDKTFLIAHG